MFLYLFFCIFNSVIFIDLSSWNTFSVTSSMDSLINQPPTLVCTHGSDTALHLQAAK